MNASAKTAVTTYVALVLLIGLTLGPVHAGAAESAPNLEPERRVAAMPLFAGVKDQFLNLVYNTFNNRTRMIQLACVGMALGLFIMFRATSKHS